MSQGTPDSNSELTLVVTDDPAQQKVQVIAAWNSYMESHDLGGKVAVIARKLGGAVDRLQRREGWDAGLTMLAMDYVVGGCCEQMYSAAIALQTEEDGVSGGKSDGNVAQSGRSGSGGRRKGKRG